MSVGLNYAARSDVGLVRSTNQDSGYAGPHLLVLADGMGGAAGGDIASSIAVAHLAPLDGEAHGGDDLLDQLRRAVAGAHRDLMAYAEEQPEAAGLGTTVIALLRAGSKIGMIHVGDSRAYLLRDRELSQVTTDHTLVEHLIATGQITEEEAEHHPQRSVILRVLGDDPEAPELDESIREAREEDRWLLCSDGLSSYVSPETIAETMLAEADPGRCADQLIDLALRAGGPDNITVVIADVVNTTDLPATAPQIVGSAATDRARPTRGGTGAAARAAALTRSPDEEHEEVPPDLDESEPRGRRALRWLLSIVVMVALLVGAGAIGYRWTQSQYYVGTDGTHVVIYQGVPTTLGPLQLSRQHQITGLELADLPPFVQSRVESSITADDLADAEQIVARLTEQGTPEEPSGEPSEDPSGDRGPNSGDDPSQTPTGSDQPSDGGGAPGPGPSGAHLVGGRTGGGS
ncbi:MAG TPA: protein phosphatase 2C domain-containing protein [Candidatus Ruania gallistercoris]|uniref:Protein phosphatase 2C domain-containing protein n=1 Tax=Candidatus Ruania gallistercoris TaxID=2838746 RepID=A0A9D2EGD6_9MICO|nr:protein phosphatase 2C domain-containing protein [Candidatus Ruania gallistercoris]